MGRSKVNDKTRISPVKAALFQFSSIIFGIIIILIGLYLSTSDYEYVQDIWVKVEHASYEVLIHIGAVLLAIGVLEILHRRLIDREFAEDLDDISDLFYAYKDLKVSNILETMEPRFFNDQVLKSKEIKMLITYFPGCELFFKEFISSESFKNSSYQIYLLDKEDEQVQKRNDTLPDDGVKSKIEQTESYFNMHNIQFKSYKSLISMPIFIFDNTAFVGFYAYGIETIYMPWVEVDMKGPFGSHIKNHFNKLNQIISESQQ